MKKMCKRGLSLFLAIVMIMGAVPMSVFAEEVCEHVNVEYIDEPATCEWEGYYAEYCNDCEQYLAEELVAANGHTYEDGICVDCGAVEETEPEEEEEVEAEETEAEQMPDVELNVAETDVAYAATREENGVILHGNNAWLDKNRDNDLMTSVMMGGLKDMVLDALNTTGDKVYYVSKDNTKYDVASLTDLMGMYEELKDSLTGQAALRFQVVRGSSVVKDEYVTLRNIAHLEIDIAINPVVSAGVPADLEEAVRGAMENAVITVTHGDDFIDHVNMSGKLFSIEYIFPEDSEDVAAQWPAATKSVESDFAVKVTVFDSVDQKTKVSKTAYVHLKDNTPEYTVTFNSEGKVWKQFKVISGQELPVDVSSLKPNRAYYTFKGWHEGVATTVNKDATYEAVWELNPAFDKNENGTPDPLENFTITYLLDEDATDAYFVSNAKYGAQTPVPADNPTMDGKIFLGWEPLNSTSKDAVIAATVTDHAIYVAKWADAANEYVVTYIKKIIGGSREVFSVVTNEGSAEYFTYAGDNKDWDGWYIADANGESTGIEFNFEKTVDNNGIDPEYLPNSTLTLIGFLGVDEGGVPGKIDGTAEDPYAYFAFEYQNQNVLGGWASLDKPLVYDDFSNQEKVDAYLSGLDLDTYFDPTENRENDKLHNGWKEIESKGEDYSKTITLHPTYADDYNNNDVDDAEESAKITVNNADLGEFSIENHEVDENGCFLANSNGDTAGKNGYETKIVVTPKKGANSFVSKIIVNGVEQELNLEDDGSAWIKIHKIAVPQVAVFAHTAPTVAYDIQVVFETMEIKFKDEPNAGVLIPGKSYKEKDVAAVYDAVVATPVRGDANVSVSYVARKAENNVTVSVKALREDIVLRYSKLADKILDKIWPGDTVTVNLNEVVMPISYEAPGMVKTPQQVVDSYILELQSADIAELMGVLATLDLTIQAKVREQANIRPFLYNAKGEAFEETLVVNYMGNRQDLTNRKTYTIEDGRPVPTITASAKTVTYGNYSDTTLLEGVTIDPAAGEVKLADSFVGRNARTYNGVPVYFAGNETYKPAMAKFNLTIKKAKLDKFEIDNVIFEPAKSTSYNAAPDMGANNDDNVQYIAVVAGLDLNDLNLDVSGSVPVANLRNVKATAWIHLPEYLETALKILGVDTSASVKRNLDDIEKLFEDYKDVLIQQNVSEQAINTLLRVLRNVNEYADANAEMEVVFTKNAYPTRPGVYVNLGIVADPRFETETDYGTILIAPVVAMPNRGNVQLKYGNRAENVFFFESDGTDKALKVTYKGNVVDADVYYFGLNSKLAVQSGTDATDVPNLPGIYLASTVYTAKGSNGEIMRLGSDVALMIIGLKDVAFDVVSGVVEEDGQGHRPVINISADDAAYTLISAEVQVEPDGDINLDDVKGIVNIEFPAPIYDLWKTFFKTLNEQDKVNVPKISENLADCEINPETLVKFLNWCEDRLNGKLVNEDVVSAINKLNSKLPQYTTHINDVKKNYANVLDKLQDAAAMLVTAAEKVQNNVNEDVVVIKFAPNKTYDKNGVYYYFGIVTDPDYKPTANGGIMIIKAPDDALVLLDTHVPYNGNGQQPVGWNHTGRQAVTLVVDKENKTVNFLLDNTARAAIGRFEETVSGSLENKTVKQLLEYGDDKVNGLMSDIYGNLGNETLVSKLKTLKDYKILMDEDLPSAVGTYQFYSYSYAIEVAKADLVIEPIYVRVTAQNNTKVYDGLDGLEGIADLNKPVVSYYSYSYVEGESRAANEVPVTNVGSLGVTVAGLGLTYDTICNGVNVGEYDITIQNATISGKYAAFMDAYVQTKSAKLTITERVIEVTAADYEKFYMDADPDFTACEVVSGSIVDGDVLEFSIARKDNDENVGEHELVVDMTKGNSNYQVIIVGGGKLTIKPAEVKVTADDIEKQFDAEQDPDFTYSYEVLNGLGTFKLADGSYDDANIRALLENAPYFVWVERKDSAPAEEAVGDEAVLVVSHKQYENGDNVKITSDNGTLTIGLGEYICWIVGGEPYNDVTDALQDAAKVGGTVQMLKDATAEINGKDEEIIIVYAGTTLDLNGYYVETDNLLSYGVVMDSLETKVNPLGGELELSAITDDGLKSGGILISNKTTDAWTQLQKANGGYMPIYDTVTGSYKFFAGKSVALGYKDDTASSVKFGCRIMLNNAEGYYILGRSEDASLDVIGEMNWTGISAFNVEYKFENATVRKYGTSAYDQCKKDGDGTTTTKGITLTVRGLDKLGSGAEITFKPVVSTVASFTDIDAEPTTYTIP